MDTKNLKSIFFNTVILFEGIILWNSHRLTQRSVKIIIALQ